VLRNTQHCEQGPHAWCRRARAKTAKLRAVSGYTRNLLAKGYADRILQSHDVCLRSHLRGHGGGGYDFLLTDFLPRLRGSGVSAEEIGIITVDNPRRALTGTK